MNGIGNESLVLDSFWHCKEWDATLTVMLVRAPTLFESSTSSGIEGRQTRQVLKFSFRSVGCCNFIGLWFDDGFVFGSGW